MLDNLTKDPLREAILSIADGLCDTVDDNFDFHLSVESEDEDVQKLAIMVNFLLDKVRRNITQLTDVQHNLEQAVAERTEELNLILQGSNDGVWLWNIRDDRVDYSARWLAMGGLPAHHHDKTSALWLSRVHPSDAGALQAAIKAHIEGVSTQIEVEYRLRHSEGNYRWMLCRGICQRDASGTPLLLAGTQTDITERMCIDQQTGLLNERGLMERVDDLIAQNKGDDSALLLISIDKQGTLMETLDGDAIRELRAQIGGRLIQAIPIRASLARFPADVFAIHIPNLGDHRRLEEVCTKVLAALNRPMNLGLAGIRWLTGSIGGLIVGDLKRPMAEDAINAAWVALRHARRGGGNTYKRFDPELRERAAAAITMEGHVRDALRNGRIVPYFQPIVDACSGKLDGFEALVRMLDDSGQPVSPGAFMPVIEGGELVVEVGEVMLDGAISQLKQWRESGVVSGDAKVSVNLAAQQLLDEALSEQVEAALKRHGLPPECLKLEVTETALIGNLDRAVASLEKIRSSGVQIALDDFGTGYSSLAYLRRLPIDVLKIDRSFIREIDRQDENHAIVKTICLLANRMGLTVVAEGVETEDEAACVSGLNVCLVQGYLYSKPLEAKAISERTGRLAAIRY